MKTSGEIGERLKSLRKARKLKQKDIAKMLDITPSTYNKIEAGVIELTLKNLTTIAEFFNISLDYLVYGKESTVNPFQSPITDTATGKDFISLESFGEYSGTIRLIIDEMKKDKAWMHHIFALYFLEKQKQAAVDVGTGKKKTINENKQ